MLSAESRYKNLLHCVASVPHKLFAGSRNVPSVFWHCWMWAPASVSTEVLYGEFAQPAVTQSVKASLNRVHCVCLGIFSRITNILPSYTTLHLTPPTLLETSASSLTNILASLTKLHLSPKPVIITFVNFAVPGLNSIRQLPVPLLPLSFTPHLITVICSTINFISLREK